jgi:hypothetical protein
MEKGADIPACSDNLRPSCSSCQQIGTPCEYTKQDASTFDGASLKILGQLSVIESLLRDIHPSSSLNLSPQLAISRIQEQLDVVRRSKGDEFSEPKREAFTLNLEASFRAATDKILKWPIFDGLLSSLPQFRFIDFQGCEAYTYLDDLFTQDSRIATHGFFESSWDSSASINISTERSDVEPLIDQFFNRVNIKNPILSRQVISQYCQQYYEHGPLFNLETCLVLLTCALGAVSMEFDPLDPGQDSGRSSHVSSRLASLRLGSRYFVAAEKRLGSAMSTVSTLAIQCLCLAG